MDEINHITDMVKNVDISEEEQKSKKESKVDASKADSSTKKSSKGSSPSEKLESSQTGKNKKSKRKQVTENGISDPVLDQSDPSTSGVNKPYSKAETPLPPFPAVMNQYIDRFGPLMLQPQKKQSFQFWSTQPVPALDGIVDNYANESIEPNKSKDEIKAQPYTLPSGYIWDTLDLNDYDVLQGLYTLLNENYVEDDDNMFRFDYSKEFLRWALMPPGWKKQWHVGVRLEKSNRLMGFISAVPASIRIFNEKKEMVEINFLCVHKKLRTKRLAPVLIKEITRRVNQVGIFQAVYTAGVVLPRPVASCRYWHRSLNPKKLIEVKFSHLGKNMTMQRALKLFKLPDIPQTKGFRKLTVKDIDLCQSLLETYLTKFDLSPAFSVPEFKHWFFPQENIIDSYVVENEGKITDFISYYTLPSTVMNHHTYKTLKAAYSFYNVSTETPWKVLMKDALIAAKMDNFDVFNALDLMENGKFLEDLKFGQGDGNLQYYLYNWRCPEMEPSKVGLVLQ